MTGLREIAQIHAGEFLLTPNQNLTIANVPPDGRDTPESVATGEANTDIRYSRHVAIGVTAFVGIIWIVHLAILLSDWNAAPLGIQPGHIIGLPGILTTPLLHGSWGHLISNSPPLLILGMGMIYGMPRAARIAIPVIWLGSGLGVWLFAREATYIGASGLIYELMFFLFIVGILRRDRQSIALTLLTFFLYGGMIWGVFPQSPGISFEYHLYGAIAGTLCALLLWRRDPLPERRRFEWEDEEEEFGNHNDNPWNRD